VRIWFYNLFIVLALTFFTTKVLGQSIAEIRNGTISAPAESIKSKLRVPVTLQQDNYVKHLAFFCRQEWKLEKALKVQFRFRVGSLEQCNRLEGKRY
jgi:hypothetical protein